jgi:hypothetical protein
VREERFSALPAASADEAAPAATANEAAATTTANEAAAPAATDDYVAGLSHDRQSIAESVSAAINLKVNSHPTIT